MDVSEPPPKPAPNRSKFWLVLGVLWPLGTILFELSTHACAGAFFDPLPSWVHVLAVLCVPGIGARAWWRSGLVNPPPVSLWERCLLGVAWVVASFYLVCFLWLTWMAFLCLPFTAFALANGELFGFLPAATLGPFWSWLFLWGAWRHLRVESSEPSRLWRSSSWIGAVSVTLILAVMELPTWVTLNAAMQSATNCSAEKARLASRVRTWGSESILRAAAYGNTNGRSSPWIWLLNGGIMLRAFDRGFNVDPLMARELYYRVYGRLFTDMPPPIRRTPMGMDEWENGRSDITDGFAWDGDVGGTVVGARMKGLALQGSRMDWHLDEPSRLAYGEWKLEFHNRHSNAQEARCQMLLPPGACVSRLTLWVNGEPREAAFAGQAKVRAAYQAVAVVQRRDPVLVTQVGPDRVLTQCFPVPAGGSMKIRLGITTPLQDGALTLPLLLERNFTISEGLRHALDVQCASAFSSGTTATTAPSGQPHRWRAELPEADMAAQTFRLPMGEKAETLWCEDPLAGDKPRFVIATPRQDATEPVKKWIVVIDGSASLRPRLDDLRRAIEHLSQTASVRVLLATGAGYEEVGKGVVLPNSAFRGGSDNAAALTQASISPAWSLGRGCYGCMGSSLSPSRNCRRCSSSSSALLRRCIFMRWLWSKAQIDCWNRSTVTPRFRARRAVVICRHCSLHWICVGVRGLREAGLSRAARQRLPLGKKCGIIWHVWPFFRRSCGAIKVVLMPPYSPLWRLSIIWSRPSRELWCWRLWSSIAPPVWTQVIQTQAPNSHSVCRSHHGSCFS